MTENTFELTQKIISISLLDFFSEKPDLCLQGIKVIEIQTRILDGACSKYLDTMIGADSDVCSLFKSVLAQFVEVELTEVHLERR